MKDTGWNIARYQTRDRLEASAELVVYMPYQKTETLSYGEQLKNCTRL